jgi:membrane protein implicated in regulation of membrane protease activity
MSTNDEGGGGWLKTILVVLTAIVAGYFALKLTFWLVKSLLFLAVAGAVGYVGYTFIKKRLGSDDDAKAPPKQLTDERATRRRSSPPRDEAFSEIDQALRELQELKRKRGE